ncbi:MAG TPA: hypothetical protein EYQ74_07780 [Planctomycetes bacterium]|nr:hypothetical protein [Planctomycetota bacterium]HIK59822.1 hypothetical protein [Planctomycetota bacterium]
MSSKPTTLSRVLALFSSYGLAIVLLACLFLLTIFGTLYQVDHGLHAAKERFFASWFLWTKLGGFSLPTFPAGMTCMMLLSINMLVGGLWRLKISRRTAGVVVVHVGIAFLLFSGLIKQWTADEGYISLAEGRVAETFRSDHLWEVSVFEVTGADSVEELVIRQGEFEDLGRDQHRRFTSDDLPFDLLLSNFMPSATVQAAGAGNGGVEVDGFRLLATPPDSEPGRNAAGLLVDINGGGSSERALLWGFQVTPWTFESGGRTWAVDLRHARYKMPFRLRLEDFQKEDHPGMGMAKAYRSDVTKIVDQREERIRIQMNEPLRSEGLVLFQSSWGPQDAGPAGPCTLDVAGSRVLMFGHMIREGRAVRLSNASGDWGSYEERTPQSVEVRSVEAATTFYARDVTRDGFRLSLRAGGPALPILSAGSGHILEEEPYSVFSVVRNVSDKWPEYSMWIITLGLLTVFVRKILGFAKTQANRRAAVENAPQGANP